MASSWQPGLGLKLRAEVPPESTIIELEVVKTYLKEQEKIHLDVAVDWKSKLGRPLEYIFNFLRKQPLMTRVWACP